MSTARPTLTSADLPDDGAVLNQGTAATSVTRSADFASGKVVHYRTNPDNLPCVAAIRPDVCALANNHVLDFGERGLRETPRHAGRRGLAVAGAGLDAAEARPPAAVPLPGGGRMLVFCRGTASSGIPPQWAATATRPGVNLPPSLSPAAADALITRARAARQRGDLVVVSIHWGIELGGTPCAATRSGSPGG